jgi:hypothetical protein
VISGYWRLQLSYLTLMAEFSAVVFIDFTVAPPAGCVVARARGEEVVMESTAQYWKPRWGSTGN